MGRTLKESLLGLGTGLASSIGLPRFLHSRLYKNRLSILMYHAVVREPLQVSDWCFLDESAFRKQIEYARRNFQVVPLSQAIAMLSQGSLEVPTLAITFDDGYQNNCDVAFPILAAHECPATIFLSTKFIDSDLLPWFGRLNLALTLTASQSLEWEGSTLKLSSPAQKASASVALHKSLKKRHPYLIDGLVSEICQKLGVDAERRFSEGSPYHMLRSSSIRAMSQSGLIDFGAHTHSHSILSRLLPGEQESEITTSVRLVKEFTGAGCTLFAYPNGSRQDYDDASIRV